MLNHACPKPVAYCIHCKGISTKWTMLSSACTSSTARSAFGQHHTCTVKKITYQQCTCKNYKSMASRGDIHSRAWLITVQSNVLKYCWYSSCRFRPNVLQFVSVFWYWPTRVVLEKRRLTTVRENALSDCTENMVWWYVSELMSIAAYVFAQYFFSPSTFFFLSYWLV